MYKIVPKQEFQKERGAAVGIYDTVYTRKGDYNSLKKLIMFLNNLQEKFYSLNLLNIKHTKKNK